MTDRGVSEVLGYVLIFALVTGTIGVVFSTGFTGLEGAQHEEKVQNIERAFDVLDDNLGDLSVGAAPSRATEVKLAGGSMTTSDPVTIRIYAENSTDATDNVTVLVDIEPIVYEESDGTAIVYTSGAVMRAESGTAVMLNSPNWLIGSDRSVLPIMDTSGQGGLSGDGAVLVVAQRESKTLGTPLIAGGSSTVRVNVTVTSPRVDAWKAYFESNGFTAIDSDTDGNDVTYQFETDGLYVPRSQISITFDR